MEVYTHESQQLDLKQKYQHLLGDFEEAEIEEVTLESFEENKTEDQAIQEAQVAVAKIEAAIPKLKVINIPPDKEIAYKQKFTPQCKLCKHPLRNQAEAMYAKYNFVPFRVQSWLKSQGEHFTWECIATHMKKHCLWDQALVNFPEKLKARQEELAPIKQNLIQWNLDALASANLDLLSQIDHMAGDEGIKTYKAVCEGIKMQAQLMKLQHDTMGSQIQAKSMIDAHNKKLIAFLQKLLKELDYDQQQNVLELIKEFQEEQSQVV